MSQETNQTDKNLPKAKKGNKGLVVGGIILTIGVIWLLRKMDIYIPGWVFGWEMILIVIGLAIGVDNKFRNPASYILILIGGVGLLDHFLHFNFNFWEYFWPLMVIFIGLMIIIRPRRRKHFQVTDDGAVAGPHDKLDLVSVFNGIKRSVLSKNFRGGETITVFGGTEINLVNADIQNTVNLECVTVFGGLKLIVPKNWEVRTDATAIFGGVEDKRFTAVEVVPENKVLIITGTVLFGGIDIVSY